jgi:hypothetical protein
VVGAHQAPSGKASLDEPQTVTHRWAFETLDPNPPQVSRPEPGSGAEGVPPDAAVTVLFDRVLKGGGEEVEFTVAGPNAIVGGGSGDLPTVLDSAIISQTKLEPRRRWLPEGCCPPRRKLGLQGSKR